MSPIARLSDRHRRRVAIRRHDVRNGSAASWRRERRRPHRPRLRLDRDARASPAEERRASDANFAAVVTIVRDVTREQQAEKTSPPPASAPNRPTSGRTASSPMSRTNCGRRSTPSSALRKSCPAGHGAGRGGAPQKYAQIIHSSGHHLLGWSIRSSTSPKIDAGSFDIVTEPFALPPLLDQCCDMVGLRAGKGGVTLLRDYPRRMDEIVADKRACKQIILNLMSNAIEVHAARQFSDADRAPEATVSSSRSPTPASAFRRPISNISAIPSSGAQHDDARL